MSKAWSRPTPCCLVAVAGDRSTMCGKKTVTVSVCLARWAPMHRYDHERCVDCFTAAGLEAML